MRKVNQSKKELHESNITDFVNHARTFEGFFINIIEIILISQ